LFFFFCLNINSSLDFTKIRPHQVRFLQNLVGIRRRLVLAVEGELVLFSALANLVHTEPLAHAIKNARHVGLDVADVVQRASQRIIEGDGNELPVHFAVVNHAENAKNLDGRDGAGLELLHADLEAIDRIVVALDVAAVGKFEGDLRRLPRLRERAVVEEDVAVAVKARHAVLGVLLDWVEGLRAGDLELGAGVLGDLADEVGRQAIGARARCLDECAHVERDVVPRRARADLLRLGVAELEVDAVVQGELLAGLLDDELVDVERHRELAADEREELLLVVVVLEVLPPGPELVPGDLFRGELFGELRVANVLGEAFEALAGERAVKFDVEGIEAALHDLLGHLHAELLVVLFVAHVVEVGDKARHAAELEGDGIAGDDRRLDEIAGDLRIGAVSDGFSGHLILF
jgi:hypothetical protein